MHVTEKDDVSYACHIISVRRQFFWYGPGRF